ncbi:MAG: D-alanyl-D-alanine carboxypeptidase [Thermodesulfovibrionales bacterium]|nr:D-alanyl-D-alanine carboxypeptidase [Thermodesulfovibrionales bacterium]
MIVILKVLRGSLIVKFPFFGIRYLLLSVIFLCYAFSVASADKISAKSVVVIDSNSEKILFAKNPHLPLPPASTTKLVTAMVALDRLDPNTLVKISEKAANIQSVPPRLIQGETYTVKELLYLALMRSVNGAAIALAEAVAGSEDAFVMMMNEKVHLMGLQNTKFINSSGLPGSGQFTTSYELALIMKAALSYPTIKEIVNTRTKDFFTLNGRHIYIKNTNYLLWKDDEHIGGKTGYTRAAGHCLVSASNKGDSTLIVAILGETARDELWQNSFLLFSRGKDILRVNSQPFIYFSDVKTNHVVKASYSKKEVTAKKVFKSKSKVKKSKKVLTKNKSKRNI